MKNKKAGVPVNLIIGFVIAYILIAVIYLLSFFLFASGLITGVTPSFSATLNATDSSRVCNYDLINFLRAIDEEMGIEYSQLLIENPTLFKENAEKFFNSRFSRGATSAKWKLSATDSNNIPVVESIGNLEIVNPQKTCKEFIPAKTPGEYYIVQLGVEY